MQPEILKTYQSELVHKMSKPALSALLCLALSCTVIALPLLPAHAPMGTVLTPPPMMTIERSDPIPEMLFRNRKLTVAFAPDEELNQPHNVHDKSTDLWRKAPKHPNKRVPTEEELKEINYYLHHHESGFPYMFDETGILLKRPKENCDPRYYCGKTEFYDKHGVMVHETPCCYWNASIFALKPNNAAECGISTAFFAFGSCLIHILFPTRRA